MKAVWDESVSQASDMLFEFFKAQKGSGSRKTNSTFEGLKMITINVIGFVCFGTRRNWGEENRNSAPPAGFHTTLMKSILTIVKKFFAATLIPSKLLMLPFMPKGARNLGISKVEFPLHLSQSIAQERRTPSSRDTLIASLVRLADQDKSPAARSLKTSTHLTEEEITGNLFSFTIAGFDTTANTLAYAIMCLAINPEWQDWIIVNISQVMNAHPSADYSTYFPVLNRCLALMVRTYCSTS